MNPELLDAVIKGMARKPDDRLLANAAKSNPSGDQHDNARTMVLAVASALAITHLTINR